jgi:hypothetical protein
LVAAVSERAEGGKRGGRKAWCPEWDVVRVTSGVTAPKRFAIRRRRPSRPGFFGFNRSPSFNPWICPDYAIGKELTLGSAGQAGEVAPDDLAATEGGHGTAFESPLVEGGVD